VISGSEGEIKTTESKPIITNSAKGFKILVVDDENINLQVLNNQLIAENYSVIQATNGDEALEIIQCEPNIDLVLLDVMMPGKSGFEVCREIRQKYLPSELPIIMVTARNELIDLVQGLNTGANDYITKPFNKDELLARIKTHLNLRFISASYSRFLPQEFLKYLGKSSILEVELGDQVDSEVTVLFADIRSYTTLSEKMTPKENFDFLNAYLKRIGPVFQKNKGFINQFYGDGLMALFVEDPEDALQAASEMQQKIAEYNTHRKSKGRSPLNVGIGMHTGALMLGIIGDQNRMDASVVSDSVNTASRMEGLTKYFGSQIILSENTLNNIPVREKYNFRFLGKVQVKGKEKIVKIFEEFGAIEAKLAEAKRETKSQFENGLEFYFKKSFTKAATHFEEVLIKNPEDKAARLYLKLSAKYMVEGVKDEWNGEIKMDDK
jgi:two-component system sensor histidine kinase ChiS